MGEPLYEEVVGRDKLDRPCRVYAPVGSHETLLAYLVRRLLENGANTSFVNRIADATVPIDELDRRSRSTPRGRSSRSARRTNGSPRRATSTGRSASNSRGLDLSDEQRLAKLADGLSAQRANGLARLSARRRGERARRAGPQPGRSRRRRRPRAIAQRRRYRRGARASRRAAPRPPSPRSRRRARRRCCAAPPTRSRREPTR